MKKHVFGRQFKRDVNERKALFRGLATELVMHERIVTTEEKAKAIRATADKLVTKAKHQDQKHALSLLQPFLSSTAAKKMLADIAPRFADRQGGYTRIIRLGRRFNDNAQTVRMEWVSLPEPVVADGKAAKKQALLASSKKDLNAPVATEKKEKTNPPAGGPKTTKKQASKKAAKKAK